MDSKTVQRSAFCRSRRELSNAYLLAKFGFDTAENEPSKVWLSSCSQLGCSVGRDTPGGLELEGCLAGPDLGLGQLQQRELRERPKKKSII